MSKGISISWSEGVNEHESQVLVGAVGSALKALYMRYPDALVHPPLPIRAFGNWIVPGLAPDRPYWGTQWYIESSYDGRVKQIIAPTYLELIRKEPWQRLAPHFDLALLDRDLTDFPSPLARLRSTEYSLGTSLPGIAAVLSVRRLRRLVDQETQDLALERLTRHHLGHALGVPSFAREDRVAKRGLELHCTHRCVMRHASTLNELAELALEEAEHGVSFCDDCERELLSIAIRHAREWN